MIKPSIDVNVSLGFWPFQQFMLRTPAALAGHMRRLGIKRALVSAVESILHPDPDVYDEPCFRGLAKHRELVPVKTVNPMLGNWKESLLSFHDRYPLGAIKLYPNYHVYDLTDECVLAAAKTARRLKLPVLVAARVEDERQHYWHMQVPGVATTAIRNLAEAVPGARFVVLNAYRYEITPLENIPPNLFFDFSFVEGPDTLAQLVETVPAKHLVFGSATPFLTTEAALAKLHLGTLPDKERERIVANGERIFS